MTILKISHSFIVQNPSVGIYGPKASVTPTVRRHIVHIPDLPDLLLSKKPSHPVEQVTFPQIPILRRHQYILTDILDLLYDLSFFRYIYNRSTLASQYPYRIPIIARSAVGHQPLADEHRISAFFAENDIIVPFPYLELVSSEWMPVTVQIVSSLPLVASANQFHTHYLRDVLKCPMNVVTCHLCA